ncbi:hypothetical protein N431DRAFT_356502 [Stipitochalara longipes BDJ]|nr:hypothetical protein N431DRAFT_356502 [Stipitochalara longipes BDJ]
MYKEESGDKRYRTFKGSYPDLVDVPSWPIVNKRLAVAPSPKIQSACASRNSSLTSFTEDNTESGEDEVTGSLQDLHFSDFSTISAECLLSQSQLDDSLVRPVLSPMKQELVERMMKEFWAYFEQQTTLKQHDRPQRESYIGAADLCDGGDNAPRSGASNSFTATAKVLQNSTGSSLGRRARDAGDDEDPNNDNKGNPKRPKKLLTSPQNEDDSPKYACPYRKRNPRKYCLHAQRWRSCALTPRESVARVKEHLYRQHSIFPCQRCKLLFEDQAAVDLHLREPQPCQLQDINHVDGITVDIVLKLKSKKKKPNQTEAERWKDIYRLLFPNDIIPDPHFEAVQEDIVLSPDSRALENYEDYCRQELPRVFRSELEAIIQAESEPIEERIRNRITNLIRDCQDQVFSSYRSSAGTIARTPSSNSTGSHSPLMAREVQPDLSTITNETSDLSSGGIAPFLLAPSPQSHLGSSLDISDLPKDILKPPSSIGHSDSGYSSGRSCIPPAVSSSYNVCTEGSSLPSFQSQSHATSQTVPSETQTTLDVNIGIPETDASNDCINSHESRAAGSPLEDYFIQFPDGTIWSPFADNMGNAGNTSYIENTGNTGNVGYMGNIRNMENIGSMEGFGDIGDMGSIGNAGSMNMGKISSMDNLGDLGNMGTGESLASSQAR